MLWSLLSSVWAWLVGVSSDDVSGDVAERPSLYSLYGDDAPGHGAGAAGAGRQSQPRPDDERRRFHGRVLSVGATGAAISGAIWCGGSLAAALTVGERVCGEAHRRSWRHGWVAHSLQKMAATAVAATDTATAATAAGGESFGDGFDDEDSRTQRPGTVCLHVHRLEERQLVAVAAGGGGGGGDGCVYRVEQDCAAIEFKPQVGDWLLMSPIDGAEERLPLAVSGAWRVRLEPLRRWTMTGHVTYVSRAPPYYGIVDDQVSFLPGQWRSTGSQPRHGDLVRCLCIENTQPAATAKFSSSQWSDARSCGRRGGGGGERQTRHQRQTQWRALHVSPLEVGGWRGINNNNNGSSSGCGGAEFDDGGVDGASVVVRGVAAVAMQRQARRVFVSAAQRLPAYPVPRHLVQASETAGTSSSSWDQLLSSCPQLVEPLSVDNYRQKLSTLLFIEEAEVRRQLRRHDMTNVVMTHGGYAAAAGGAGAAGAGDDGGGECLRLEVPGLAEGRPSLVVGDRALLSHPDLHPGVVYEGCIHQVRQSSVLLRFCADFHATYTGQQYNVTFDFSRTRWRHMHRAVDTAVRTCLHHILLLTPPMVEKYHYQHSRRPQVEFDDDSCSDDSELSGSDDDDTDYDDNVAPSIPSTTATTTATITPVAAVTAIDHNSVANINLLKNVSPAVAAAAAVELPAGSLVSAVSAAATQADNGPVHSYSGVSGAVTNTPSSTALAAASGAVSRGVVGACDGDDVGPLSVGGAAGDRTDIGGASVIGSASGGGERCAGRSGECSTATPTTTGACVANSHTVHNNNNNNVGNDDSDSNCIVDGGCRKRSAVYGVGDSNGSSSSRSCNRRAAVGGGGGGGGGTGGGGGRLATVRWFNQHLNRRQRRAVRCVLRAESRPLPYIIYGPPGTGKTVTLVECALQLLQLVPHSRQLLVAATNSAADLITARLAGASRRAGRQLSPAELVQLCAFNRDLSGGGSSGVGGAAAAAAAGAENVVRDYMVQLGGSGDGGCQLEAVCRRRIVVGTAAVCGQLWRLEASHSGGGGGWWTHVLVDEAGCLTEPETLVPLALMFVNGTAGGTSLQGGQLVLAGDPQQLGAVLQSPAAGAWGLSVSLLERLCAHPLYGRQLQRFPAAGGYDPRLLTKLVRSYRTCRRLLHVPSQLFYHGELVATGGSCSGRRWRREHRRQLAACQLPRADFPLAFVGVSGPCLQEPDSASWFNPAQVFVAVQWVQRVLASGVVASAHELGVIAPYRKHAQKVRQLLARAASGSEEAAAAAAAVRVGSVEEFQGQERSVIIVTTVRAQLLSHEQQQHEQQQQQLLQMGFMSQPKRFNVSVTRARRLLIVIGCPHTLAGDRCWRRLLRYAVRHGAYTGCPLPADFATSDDSDHDDTSGGGGGSGDVTGGIAVSSDWS